MLDRQWKASMKIGAAEFKFWSKYIRRISGIHLDESKGYLLEMRLSGLLKAHKCLSFMELLDKAETDTTRSIEKAIIDQITTNETRFFRDSAPFDLLKYKILPDVIDQKVAKTAGWGMPVRIRVLSVGCSTGQEVYSIAIAAKELIGDMGRYGVQILGTDISGAAIARASKGIFSRFEVERGLDPERRDRFLRPDGDRWKICDEIRSFVSFKKLNFMDAPKLGKFEIIFCRNVAIYFSSEDRWKLFGHLAQMIDPQGYLIVGATEAVASIYPQFEPKRYLKSIFYQLKRGDRCTAMKS